MAFMREMTECLGRRGTFLVLYALISILVGILNMVYLTAGPNPWQWVVLVVLDRSQDEGVLRSLLNGIASDDPFPVFQLCLMAPFVLVTLAFLRGRRLGMPYMVVLPLIGLVVTFLGALPFGNWGPESAIAAPSLVAWLFDGWCLYLGAQSEPVNDAA